jgi:hypothetical protein
MPASPFLAGSRSSRGTGCAACGLEADDRRFGGGLESAARAPQLARSASPGGRGRRQVQTDGWIQLAVRRAVKRIGAGSTFSVYPYPCDHILRHLLESASFLLLPSDFAPLSFLSSCLPIYMRVFALMSYISPRILCEIFFGPSLHHLRFHHSAVFLIRHGRPGYGGRSTGASSAVCWRACCSAARG